jgi:hypothetical protein
MDPNEALKRARKAAARIRELQDKEDLTKEEAEEHEQEHENLVESFEALDGWLSGGGFLPAAWKAGR